MVRASRLVALLCLCFVLWRRVAASPQPLGTVELVTCGVQASAALINGKCDAVCTPVHDAQSCNRRAACTCTLASPAVVQTCLQCHMGTDKGSGSAKIDALIASRLEAYAALCGDDLVAVDAMLPDTTALDHSEPNTRATVSRRGTAHLLCIYALPEVVSAAPPVLAYVASNRLWLFLAFPVVALLCIILRRSSRSSNSSTN
ncbi:hypothetical protein CERSUDRAFT_116646 [Gelatoporia subvermispora B]|uniref:Extracellular membrane protein CFEM domain-containing protein n=1 Tax=Ceriporiopsis subvermispora (strain B) TaxID=914234 RepID=M2R9Q5_CERS8|nr:hypothetical protein CERSUDRAFT_116646 [Gelatoporia subvermispora B]